MLNHQRDRRVPHPRVPYRAALTTLGLLAVCAVLLAGCGRDLAEPASAEEISSGQEIYLLNCARCHQADGQGYRNVYPTLRGNQLVTLHDPQPMLDIILNGRGGMPALRGSLTITEVALVASYIRGAWGNEASHVTPAEVR